MTSMRVWVFVTMCRSEVEALLLFVLNDVMMTAYLVLLWITMLALVILLLLVFMATMTGLVCPLLCVILMQWELVVRE